MNHRRQWFVICCFILIITACGQSDTADSASVPSPSAIADDVATSATVTANHLAPDTSTTEKQLLVATVDRSVKLFPVDPATLDPLPGYQPIDLGHHSTHALSPDGHTMAVFIWASETGGGDGSGTGGQLHLIDLTSWTVSSTNVVIDVNIGRLFFSSGGQRLYWFQAHRLDFDQALYQYDIGTGRLDEVLQLSPDLFLWEVHQLANPDRLAVIGVPGGTDYHADDIAQLFLIDLEQAVVTSSLQLDGVNAWQHEQTLDENAYPYRIYDPGFAWDDQHDQLYIAHPDQEIVTVVDLTTGQLIRQTTIRRSVSLRDRITSWLFPSAAASPVPWTQRQALLTQDGMNLIISGRRDEWTKAEGTNWTQGWEEVEESFGLQVIDAETAQELHHVELPPVRAMVLSPDGQQLLVHTYRLTTDEGSHRQRLTEHRVYLFDTTTFEELGRIDLDADWVVGPLEAAGQYTYLQLQTSAGDQVDLEVLIIDPTSLAIVNRRTYLDARWIDLITIVGELS